MATEFHNHLARITRRKMGRHGGRPSTKGHATSVHGEHEDECKAILGKVLAGKQNSDRL
jgi:hypothetical protein